jgi:hypothetical protein
MTITIPLRKSATCCRAEYDDFHEFNIGGKSNAAIAASNRRMVILPKN